MSERQYLVSFICDGQPQTDVLHADEETLSVEAALALLRRQEPELDAKEVSDVQVQKRNSTDKTEGVPGHYQQP
jgi:hypothetical protein